MSCRGTEYGQFCQPEVRREDGTRRETHEAVVEAMNDSKDRDDGYVDNVFADRRGSVALGEHRDTTSGPGTNRGLSTRRWRSK